MIFDGERKEAWTCALPTDTLEAWSAQSPSPAVPCGSRQAPARIQTSYGTVPAAPEDPIITSILEKIQTYVYQRRIRGRDSFFSFDPLHTGRCTVDQFVRVVNNIAPGVSANDSRLLAEHYTEENATHPQIVSYNRFCRRVDEVFAPSNLERTPTLPVPRAGAKVQRGLPSPRARAASSAASARAASAAAGTSVTPGVYGGLDDSLNMDLSAIDEEQRLNQILQKLALLLQTRRVIFRDCFQDCERADATSLMTPRYSGKVTTAQFRQHFPFMREIGEADVELLVSHYGVGDRGGAGIGDGTGGAVHFAALDNDLGHVDLPPATGGMSTFGTPTSGARLTPRTPWRRGATPQKPPTCAEVLTKIRADISDRRSILSGSAFLEFDKLRRGVCKLHHVKPVLTVLRIELDEPDFQALAEAYSNSQGMFRYRDFCKDIVRRDLVLPTPGGITPGRSAGNTPPVLSGIESRPTTSGPPPTARGPHFQDALHDIEMHIRKQVQSRRLMLRSVFQDFDRVRNGRVTQKQFARIMGMVNINLNDEDIALLCEAYGEASGRGLRDTPVNSADFKYLDFCAAVDIRADWMNTPASTTPGPSKYFDRGGRIMPSPHVPSRQHLPLDWGGSYGAGDRRPYTR